MKNKLIYIALLGSLLLVTRTGVAGTEGENYFGLQYADGDYEEDGISETFNPTLLVGRYGRFLTPNFSVEGRLGFDLDDDTQNLPELGNRDATLELERLFGLYGTGHFNIAKSFSIYGVLGVSNVKGTVSVPSISGLESTEDNTSVSYGIGADIGIGSSWALNIEYIRYLDDDDFELDMANVGASFSF
jgi:opacity protein-like surface antigen